MLSAAEVYSALGGVEQTDYTERGGRYTSDFIWNTKWKDQVRCGRGCSILMLQCSRYIVPPPPSLRTGRSVVPILYSWCLQLDLEISQKEAKKKASEEGEASTPGGLSFTRLADLNRYGAGL